VGALEASTNDQDATVGIKCNANHRGIILQENSGAEQWEIGVGAAGALKFYDSGSATPAVTFADETGNVGIGTTSPSTTLDVHSSTNGHGLYIAQDNAGDGYHTRLTFQGSNGSGGFNTIAGLKAYQEANGTNGYLRFDTNGDTERMRIDSSGNVGIGTTSYQGSGGSGAKGTFIEQDGLFSAARSGGTVAVFNRTTSNGTIIDLRKDGTIVGNIGTYDVGNGKSIFMASDGKGLRVENYQGTGSVVPCNGSGTNLHNSINLGTSASRFKNIYLVNNPNVSSDQRLKENIADADDAGSTIDAIQVRKFDWIEDGRHQSYGMIAQELAEVYPEAVNVPENSEDTLGIATADLIPMLIKEVQSLRSRVAELENK